MKKNECAQEMILDLVMRHGCEVRIRPHVVGLRAVEIVIHHRGEFSSIAIDLERIEWMKDHQEEAVCREIEMAAIDLFRLPYREMIDKHFHAKKDGDGNG